MSRFQFSLRTMLAAVAVVGIGAALWVAEPSWQVGAVESLLLAWVPASAAVLSVHSIGKAKAFWMGVTAGCILPPIPLILVAPTKYDYSIIDLGPKFLGDFGFYLQILSGSFHVALVGWAFAPVVGLLCVLTHWLLIRPPQGPKD